MIRFACPYCYATMQAGDGLAGATIRCQKCQQEIGVPVPVPTGDPAAEVLPPSEAPLHQPPPVRRDALLEAATSLPSSANGFSPSLLTPSTPLERPPRRRINFFSPLFGFAGAVLLGVGAFYPLVNVTQTHLQVGNLPIEIQFSLYWTLPVQIAAVLLALSALAILFARLYWGYWVLGLGTLASLGGAYYFFFHYRVQEMARQAVQQQGRSSMDPRQREEIVAAVASCFQPGLAFAYLSGGAALLVLAAWYARRHRRAAYRVSG